MKVNERIKSRRVELGLSVDQLAEKLGINRATIYRYESEDISKLPASILQPLADVLQTTPHYLMGWSDAPTSAPGGPSAEKTLSESQLQLLNLLPDLNEDDIDDLLLLANSKAARHKSQDDVK